MLRELLIVGTALVVLIFVSVSRHERRGMAIACGVALACFVGAAYSRADTWWILVDVLGAAVTGWVACALLSGRSREDSDAVLPASAPFTH